MAAPDQNQNEIEVIRIPLAWLDANVNEKENEDLRKQIGINFGRCRFLKDIDEYNHFITTNSNEYVLIISGALGMRLNSTFQEESKISKVYVYCNDVAWHKQWAAQYSKVRSLVM